MVEFPCRTFVLERGRQRKVNKRGNKQERERKEKRERERERARHVQHNKLLDLTKPPFLDSENLRAPKSFRVLYPKCPPLRGAPFSCYLGGT